MVQAYSFCFLSLSVSLSLFISLNSDTPINNDINITYKIKMNECTIHVQFDFLGTFFRSQRNAFLKNGPLQFLSQCKSLLKPEVCFLASEMKKTKSETMISTAKNFDKNKEDRCKKPKDSLK